MKKAIYFIMLYSSRLSENGWDGAKFSIIGVISIGPVFLHTKLNIMANFSVLFHVIKLQKSRDTFQPTFSSCIAVILLLRRRHVTCAHNVQNPINCALNATTWCVRSGYR